jgi:hypothetical protein
MLSERGEEIQKKVWTETIAVFQEEVPEADPGMYML